MNFSFLHTIRFSNYIVVCAFKQSKYPLFQVQLCEVVYLYNQTSFNGNLPQYLQTVKNSKKLNSRTRVLARKMFPLYLRGGSMSGEDELLHVQNQMVFRIIYQSQGTLFDWRTGRDFKENGSFPKQVATISTKHYKIWTHR